MVPSVGPPAPNPGGEYSLGGCFQSFRAGSDVRSHARLISCPCFGSCDVRNNPPRIGGQGANIRAILPREGLTRSVRQTLYSHRYPLS
jgi:hypothetical protein